MLTVNNQKQSAVSKQHVYSIYIQALLLKMRDTKDPLVEVSAELTLQNGP